MKLNKEILKKMIRAIANTKPDEIGCGECYEKLETFAEITLEGKSPEEAMPLVQDHLDRCQDCREEFKALLEALKPIYSSK